MAARVDWKLVSKLCYASQQQLSSHHILHYSSFVTMVFDSRYYRFHVKVSDSFLPFVLLIISIPFLSSEHSFNRDNVFVIKKGFVFRNKRNSRNERVQRTIESLPQIRSFADTLLIVSAEFPSYFPLVAPRDKEKANDPTNDGSFAA